MKIERRRYVVMRKNRTEVWCGLAKHFSFRPIADIKDVSVKTYRSEAQAYSGCSSELKESYYHQMVLNCKAVTENEQCHMVGW